MVALDLGDTVVVYGIKSGTGIITSGPLYHSSMHITYIYRINRFNYSYSREHIFRSRAVLFEKTMEFEEVF